MSAVFGVEGWPTLSTYIGVTVVTIGIFQVVWFQMKREKQQEEAKKEGTNSAVNQQDATPKRQTRKYQKIETEMTEIVSVDA